MAISFSRIRQDLRKRFSRVSSVNEPHILRIIIDHFPPCLLLGRLCAVDYSGKGAELSFVMDGSYVQSFREVG